MPFGIALKSSLPSSFALSCKKDSGPLRLQLDHWSEALSKDLYGVCSLVLSGGEQT